MSKPEFVYVIYIASTPEKVFQALTDEKMSEQYWVGNRVVSDWKIGAPFTLKLKHEEKDVTGKVLEFDPPRRIELEHLAGDVLLFMLELEREWRADLPIRDDAIADPVLLRHFLVGQRLEYLLRCRSDVDDIDEFRLAHRVSPVVVSIR